MSPSPNTMLRGSLALLVAFSALQPLRAQFSQSLATQQNLYKGTTDFTDLFKQSTSVQAKPEIVSIFDFSRSMASLMFHPLYQNGDKGDLDDYRYMKFQLTTLEQAATSGSSGGANQTVTYTVTAKPADGCTTAAATLTVTVNSAGTTTVVANATGASCGGNTSNGSTAPAAFAVTVKAAGNTSATAATTFQPGCTTNTTSCNHTDYSYKSDTFATVQGTSPTFPPGQYTITRSDKSQTTPIIQVYTDSGFTTAAGGTYTHAVTYYLTAYIYHPTVEGESPLPPTTSGTVLSSSTYPWLQGTWSGTGVTALSTYTTTTAGLYKTTAKWVVPDFQYAAPVANPIPSTQLQAIKFLPSSGWGPGTQLTLSDYFKTIGTSTGTINWTVAQSGVTCGTVGTISPTSTTGNTTTASGGNVLWTIPNCKPPTTGATGGTAHVIPIVTVTLDATASAYMGTSAYTSSGGVTAVGSLSATTAADGSASATSVLRKPDGTAVLYTDIDAATGITLPGGSAGGTYVANDIRNWIRAASHVRFTVSGRVIDIPIPWKIYDPTSKTIPLASLTVTDTENKVTKNSDGSTTTTQYGSGNPIELDRTYGINTQNGAVLTTDTTLGTTANSGSATTTVYLYSCVYRPAYIAWLFKGKYQSTSATQQNYTHESSLNGKYIVYNAYSTDTGNALYGAAGQGSNLAWGAGCGSFASTDTINIPQYNLDGTPLMLADGVTYAPSITKPAANYAIPTLTRVQAIKKAAITTWTQHQADVFWAFRCLDTTNEALTAGISATSINNDSTSHITSGDPTTTHMDGVDSGWTVLNSASVTGMNRIASLFANGGTPLTYAMARTLAQYGDPNSVFNTPVGSNVSQCVNHYLMLFTDGVDNNGVEGTSTNPLSPYFTYDSNNVPLSLNVVAGNHTIMGTNALINSPSGTNWNLHTYAGIGAHLGDLTLGTGNYMAAWNPGAKGSSLTNQAPSGFLPFSIFARNGVTFNIPQEVTTMTVGVSLGGVYTDSTSPKYSLYLAAVQGQPKVNSGVLKTDFHPFTSADFNSTTGSVAAGAVFFFDATDPNSLQTSMNAAFNIAIAATGNNATSSPTLPFIGASLGKEIYMGSFQPPFGGGVIWPGDLMMFGTSETNGVISILDKSGAVTTNLTKANAGWTASNALSTANRFWDAATIPSTSTAARSLWTRLPSTSSGSEPALTQFTYTLTNKDGSANKSFDDGSGGGLQKYVATAQTYSNKQIVVQRAMGGDTVNTGTPPTIPPTANRADIMGDVIGSAPNAVEYTLSDWTSKLPSALSGAVPADGSGVFRLILVGTNQGWLHAFGEVTSNKTTVGAAVDELWAFMPTDFLNNLDYILSPNNPHHLMVDGPPSIYFLDLPSSGGNGNGKIDKGERAIAIIGLGKGGRSYYALDISNPFTPALKWSLVPDEMANFNTARNLTGMDNTTLTNIISNMGFSTGSPAFGRILYNNVLRDAVFLGGGFSVPNVDTAFGAKLGRSVLALDVYTGEVLAAVDLTGITLTSKQKAIGPVGSGVIPFEFIANSGMAQRAYFMDYTGGLFAWGSKALGTGSYSNFRADTSELSKWNIRRVFQDDNTMQEITTGNYTSNRYTVPPAPFKVGSFAGPVLSGEVTPAAVGIAMVSGDRNNPVDQYSDGSNGYTPYRHQLSVVFDRQDSYALGLDDGRQDNGPDTGIVPNAVAGAYSGQLVPLPTGPVTTTPSPVDCSAGDDSDKAYQVFTSGCPDFFLGNGTDYTKWKYGFYINFPAVDSTTGFVSKGINPPLLDANSLFYSYFTPTSYNYCNGGLGTTYTRLVADVNHPIDNDSRTNQVVTSGAQFDWAGVASNFIAVGNQVVQGGTITSGENGITTGSSTAVPYLNAIQTNAGTRHSRVRVWRTIQ